MKSSKEDRFGSRASRRRPLSPTTPSIAAVIPAYNEAGRIEPVLRILGEEPRLNQIVVVDDGSRDDTAGAAWRQARRDPRIRVLVHPRNKGKGEALFTAWRATQAACLLMLDADLVNLRREHVADLIQPVATGEVDMTLGLFRSGWWYTDLSHWITPWLTGQRCFRAELLRYVPVQAAGGYGLETALTLVARQRGWRIASIPMVGVTHIPSEIHRGFWEGMRTRGRMYRHILTAWYLTSSWPRLVSRLRTMGRLG